MKKALPLLLLFNIFIATAGINPPSGTISYNSPFCQSSTLEYVIMNGLTPGGTFSASPTGLSINAATGEIQPSTSQLGTYTVSYDIPAGVDPAFSTTAVVTINNYVQPDFPVITQICPNSAVPILATTSPNGISGTWSPSVISNLVSGIYVFTPNAEQCASLLTIQVNVEMVEPIFTFPPYNVCSGSIPALPTVSANGITGTWFPTVINQTGIYTFTPDDGQCASIVVNTFVVSPLPVATLTVVSPVCAGNNAVVTFNGTPNSVITYSFDGGANQTIVLNATGTTTITTPTLTSMSLICLISATDAFTNCTNPLTGCAQIIVAPSITIAPIPNVFSCQPYVLPALTVGNYYTNFSGGGTMLHAGDAIEFSQHLYVFAQDACSQNEVSFDVSINSQPVITHLPDITACQYYELPINNEAGYYTEPHGGGIHLSGNIYSTQTIYLYIATGPYPYCIAEDSFHVTIIPAVNPEIVSDNGTHFIYVDNTTVVAPLLLDSQLTGNYSYQWFNYFDTIPGATNATYLVDTYTAEQAWSIFVRATNLDTGCVTSSAVFWVYQSPVPPPTGDVNQTFTLGQTLADVVVTGSNIQWYDVLNRNASSNPLPLSTVLVEGVTYYATQTINGYESSSAFEITIQFLANNTFSFKDLRFSPNPVQEILNIESQDVIKNVTVYNIMGQKVMQQNFNSLDLRLQLSQLKTGNYFIKLESDNRSQVIKVIKE